LSGFTYTSAASAVTGTYYRITTVDTADWSSVGGPTSAAVGDEFTATATATWPTGGAAYEVAYLAQPYNSDFDFGYESNHATTPGSDFSIEMWVDTNNGSHYLFDRWDSGQSGKRIYIYRYDSSVGFEFNVGSNSAANSVQTNETSPEDVWIHLVCLRKEDYIYIYVNGELKASKQINDTVDNSSSVTTIGTKYNAIGPLNGSLTLPRITGTALSAAEIKRHYESEKPMFNENAKCTLNGSSDAVTALAHDDITNELHASTSGGRSVFQGLVRVDENTTNTTLVAAHDGLVVAEEA